jgi:S1-C subfamily serine protease
MACVRVQNRRWPTLRVPSPRLGWPVLILAVLLAGPVSSQSPTAPANDPPASPGAPPARPSLSADELVSGVVRIKTMIHPEGRTVETLGREREGSGVVIDGKGLVVTIGYLMVEAHAAEITTNDGRTVSAEIVAYDYDTGFGLLRATVPLNVRPMALGKSADIKRGDRVLVAAGGGTDMAGAAEIAAKREFAGYWEYLLDEALFASPPHPAWSGAALVSREGRLLGIGSLVVGDTSGTGAGVPGNMFVPIDLLPPILADLVANGRVSARAKPWLGLNTAEAGGVLVVNRVIKGGPAEKAGVRKGDAIVGIGGAPAAKLGDFYRKLFGSGEAGVTVPLDIKRDGQALRLDLQSVDRHTHLKLNSTF